MHVLRNIYINEEITFCLNSEVNWKQLSMISLLKTVSRHFTVGEIVAPGVL